jgi:hypothetical protein
LLLPTFTSAQKTLNQKTAKLPQHKLRTCPLSEVHAAPGIGKSLFLVHNGAIVVNGVFDFYGETVADTVSTTPQYRLSLRLVDRSVSNLEFVCVSIMFVAANLARMNKVV